MKYFGETINLAYYLLNEGESIQNIVVRFNKLFNSVDTTRSFFKTDYLAYDVFYNCNFDNIDDYLCEENINQAIIETFKDNLEVSEWYKDDQDWKRLIYEDTITVFEDTLNFLRWLQYLKKEGKL